MPREQIVRRKPWKALCIAVFLLALLLVVAILILRTPQQPAFNDSDLIFSRTEVPIESNAFWTLAKATNELYWPDPLGNKLDDLSNNTNWDDLLASDVLKKNQKCLDLLDASARQPSFLVPQPKDFAEDYPYLSSWRTFTRLLMIRANSLYRANDDKDAIDSALKTLQFGQRAENSGGGTEHYMVGSAIKTVGLRNLRQMIASSTLKQADLMVLFRELGDFEPNKEGLTNALEVDYQVVCKWLDQTAGTKITNSMLGRIVMNPIKTKMEFAQSARLVRDNISTPFAKIPWSDLPILDTNAPEWRRLVKGNVMGEILLEMQCPSYQRLASRISSEEVNVTATQLLLALKVYKIRNGKLPESFSGLVPEFFPQVPIDDFDGQPFRYSPDKKIIYSVGPCLKDLGGEGFHEDSTNYNLPFKIEF